MRGTIASATRAMLLMPPMMTRATATARITPVIHIGRPSDWFIAAATEFDWTMFPIPTDAMNAKKANSQPSHFQLPPYRSSMPLLA